MSGPIVIDHPVCAHHLGVLRDAATAPAQFRAALEQVTALLVYEATRDLTVGERKVRTPLIETTRSALNQRIGVVPILRAGMGMLDGVLDLIPGAKVSVVGHYRNEETLEPVCYYVKLASNLQKRTALILDPMLATGGTLLATITQLKEAGCTRIRGIFLVAAPEGLDRVSKAHPDVDIHVAGIDERLNDHGYILPGLGDAGDKIFGTK